MSARTICHAIDYGAPTGGSFIPALASLSRALVARGDRFVVFATEIPGATWPRELAAAGADVQMVRDVREFTTALRTLCPDVIHSHFNRFDLASALANRYSRIFWHVHSIRERRSPLSRLRAFAKYRIIGTRVDAVVTVSDAMREECIAWFASPDRLHVVNNGVDIEHFRPPVPQERSDARDALGISPGDRIVLFFERVTLKGGAVVKDAMDSLPRYRLLVVGGNREDRERFGTAPKVLAIDRAADVRPLYWAADALAFASDREAFGLVLVEALACGLPIAASDIPVVHEICDGIESVALFQVGDAQGLANAIERAVASKNAEQARSRVVDRFSLERWTADTLRLYDSLPS
jgi:glycosyltransferase involved in cell wall biosynthesis